MTVIAVMFSTQPALRGDALERYVNGGQIKNWLFINFHQFLELASVTTKMNISVYNV